MGFINYLINGVSLGSVYAIIALGYTMVYGIAKMLNFAHGDVIMIGSYVVFVTVSTMGFPPMVGVLVAVLACTLLGMTIERVAYKPLRGASPLAVLITAIGVSYLLQNVALLIFGADTKSFTSVVTIPRDAAKAQAFGYDIPLGGDHLLPVELGGGTVQHNIHGKRSRVIDNLPVKHPHIPQAPLPPHPSSVQFSHSCSH